MALSRARDTQQAGVARGSDMVRLAVVFGIIVMLIGCMILLPARQYLAGLLEWARSLGMWGPVLVAAAYIPACVLFLPGSVITMGAGFLFGMATGTVAVSVGSTLGAATAFLIGRTVARRWIARKVAGNARFEALDAAVGREGFRIVLLTRLSPMFPFNLLNYALGLTRVPFGRYLLASWIGMLPGTVMYVYIGTGLSSLAAASDGSRPDAGPASTVLLWVGLAMTILATAFVTRLARRALQTVVKPQERKTRFKSADVSSKHM